jgi:hypothetical protein
MGKVGGVAGGAEARWRVKSRLGEKVQVFLCTQIMCAQYVLYDPVLSLVLDV